MSDTLDDLANEFNEEVETTEEEVEEVEEDKEELETSSEEEGVEAEVEEEEEETEEEIEDEEVEEEKKARPSKYHRPIFSEIKKEFPTFFEKFPDMREVYFREGQYSLIFPTIDEAEEAFTKSTNFDTLASTLTKGDPKVLLDELEKSGTDKIIKLAENFLPDIRQRSEKLYYHLITPAIAEIIKTVHNAGSRNGNEDLQASALHFAKFFFDDIDIDKLEVKREEDPNIKQQRLDLERREKETADRDYNSAMQNVALNANKLLLSEITKNIKDKVGDSYKREKATQDIFKKVQEVLSKDERHIKLMRSLWNKSKSNNYSLESRKRLVTTLLVRAKQVLPAISKEIMNIIEPGKNKKVVKKVVKKVNTTENNQPNKKILGGLPKDKSDNATKPTGKVDWNKYDGSERSFLDSFIANKGKVKRT